MPACLHCWLFGDERRAFSTRFERLWTERPAFQRGQPVDYLEQRVVDGFERLAVALFGFARKLFQRLQIVGEFAGNRVVLVAAEIRSVADCLSRSIAGRFHDEIAVGGDRFFNGFEAWWDGSHFRMSIIRLGQMLG